MCSVLETGVGTGEGPGGSGIERHGGGDWKSGSEGTRGSAWWGCGVILWALGGEKASQSLSRALGFGDNCGSRWRHTPFHLLRRGEVSLKLWESELRCPNDLCPERWGCSMDGLHEAQGPFLWAGSQQEARRRSWGAGHTPSLLPMAWASCLQVDVGVKNKVTIQVELLSPNSYVEVLIPRTPAFKFMWRWDISQVKVMSLG